MRKGGKIYSWQHKKVGTLIGYTVESGFDMLVAKFDEDTHEYSIYPKETLDLEEEYSNSAIWDLIDSGVLPVCSVLSNDKGELMLFNGAELLNHSHNTTGMSKGRKWKIVDITK